MDREKLRILFIGNSHTYYNDMPERVAQRAREENYDCQVTMLAHPGWYLLQHVKEPDVKFNIQYGHYDYVVLQEHSHPFGPVEDFRMAAHTLGKWIHQVGSCPVIYMTWAQEEKPEEQETMTSVHRSIAKEIDALVAPVGEFWWDYKRSWPNIEMYAADGEHASEAGSDFAAKTLWEVMHTDFRHRSVAR